jgi:anti-anti-sigma factor
MANIEITNIKENDITIIQINGRIDSKNASTLDTHCKNLIADGFIKLLIDLKKVQYINSTGLRVFLVLAKAIKSKKGKLVLCSLNSMVKEVMEISGFNQIIMQTDNKESALKLFKCLNG